MIPAARHRRQALRWYSVSVRYRRPDGKLAWFCGIQLAPNLGEADRLGREAFTAEVPATKIVAIFVSRLPRTE